MQDTAQHIPYPLSLLLLSLKKGRQRDFHIDVAKNEFILGHPQAGNEMRGHDRIEVLTESYKCWLPWSTEVSILIAFLFSAEEMWLSSS